MSRIESIAFSSIPSPMAMATGAMEPAALRLCRSTHGTHVPSNRRCTLQVAGCPYDVHYTIDVLRVVFAIHGLPRKVITKNGPSFTSSEFKNFMQEKWHTSHHIRLLPPLHKRFGRKRCSNVKTGPQTHSRIDYPRETVEIFV